MTRDPQTLDNPETAHFWQAAANGTLLLKHCPACGQYHWYPRSHCPHCGHGETQWVPSAGRGSIYSFTILRRDHDRVVAYVELDEGVCLFTNIVECSPEALAIGQRVFARLHRQDDGAPLVVFVPDGLKPPN